MDRQCKQISLNQHVLRILLWEHFSPPSPFYSDWTRDKHHRKSREKLQLQTELLQWFAEKGEETKWNHVEYSVDRKTCVLGRVLPGNKNEGEGEWERKWRKRKTFQFWIFIIRNKILAWTSLPNKQSFTKFWGSSTKGVTYVFSRSSLEKFPWNFPDFHGFSTKFTKNCKKSRFPRDFLIFDHCYSLVLLYGIPHAGKEKVRQKKPRKNPYILETEPENSFLLIFAFAFVRNVMYDSVSLARSCCVHP